MCILYTIYLSIAYLASSASLLENNENILYQKYTERGMVWGFKDTLWFIGVCESCVERYIHSGTLVWALKTALSCFAALCVYVFYEEFSSIFIVIWQSVRNNVIQKGIFSPSYGLFLVYCSAFVCLIISSTGVCDYSYMRNS